MTAKKRAWGEEKSSRWTAPSGTVRRRVCAQILGVIADQIHARNKPARGTGSRQPRLSPLIVDGALIRLRSSSAYSLGVFF
jgi:hypothetical protein